MSEEVMDGDLEFANTEARIRQERMDKAEAMRVAGRNPYANDWRIDGSLDAVRKQFAHLGSEPCQPVEDESRRIAGRVMNIRRFGKAAFLVLRDRSGDLQVMIRKNVVTGDGWDDFLLVDRGDHVGAAGNMFVTKTGELSVMVSEFRLLTKSLRPLPEKWKGLTDVEQRYRRRYVDLIVNPEARDTFRARANILRKVRDYFDAADFIEVETPSLHGVAGGAAAKPFKTHHNALDMDLKLRIATELHLKRLVVGGLERVYEIGKNFRNEGISVRHNPEFTAIEFYEAYADVETMMERTEELLHGLVMDLHGTEKIPFNPELDEDGDGWMLDFSRPFRRLSIVEGIVEYAGVPADKVEDREWLINFAKSTHHLELKKETILGKVQLELFEACAEPQLIHPTFICDHPTDVSPLSRAKEDNPLYTDRFELVVAKMELVNAFSELNDPLDQRARFEQQLAERDKGDDEAHELDEDFLLALEYGMPPTGGFGMGIDRLVMLLTNKHSIREVICFPQLRKV